MKNELPHGGSSTSESQQLVEWGHKLHLRQTTKKRGSVKNSEAILTKLQTNNDLDIQLYNFGLDLFWNRYCAAAQIFNPITTKTHPKCKTTKRGII